MTTSFGYGNGEPGLTSALSTAESNIFWGTDPTKLVQYDTVDIVSTAVDAGNTPTTLLRAGLVLGKVAATGQYTTYSATATDGSQQAVAVLPLEINMLDPYQGTVQNRVAAVVICGPVRASALANLDNFARQQLTAQGFLFDDVRTGGYGIPFIRVVNKAADYTVTVADNDTLFTASAAVNFTLPTLAAGLNYSFYNLADSNLTITASTGDTIITDGDAAADSVAFSTSSHKIGGGVRFVANADASKWLTFFQGAAPANVVTVAT
ncbi:MAG: head decoration protein [Planctomycetota bacterium]